ncbi:MAG TPA: hypothetical protein VJ652_05270 [Noviherbaspirillum sp.]|nr:hypothetical protein [Noviherbaspirillum sp.]
MKHAAPILAAIFTVLAHAEVPPDPMPFEARVQLAREAETDDRFKPYQATMIRRAGRQLARTVRSCRAAAPAPERKSVVLVADIGADGRARAIDITPDNAAGRCMAAGFASIRYPKPPAYPERPGFPVTMKVSFER